MLSEEERIQKFPYFSLASNVWYDLLGTITEETLIDRWNTIGMMPEISKKAELVEKSPDPKINNKMFQLQLWRESLIQEEGMIIVNHVDKVIYDGELYDFKNGSLDGWAADYLARPTKINYRSNNTNRIKAKIPLILETLKLVQSRFDKSKEDYPDNFEEVLWKYYKSSYADEDSLFPTILGIPDR